MKFLSKFFTKQKEKEIDKRFSGGITPLMYASDNGMFGEAKACVDAGANLDLQDDEGRTALMYASQNGYLEIVLLLVNSGANTNLQTNEGATALMYSLQYHQLEIVQLLVKKGASIDLQTNEGVTALMYASQEGFKDIVKLFLLAGAKSELKSKDGRTANDYTVDKEIIYLLDNDSSNISQITETQEVHNGEDEEFAVNLCHLGRKHMEAYNSGDKESDEKIWEEVEKIGKAIKDSGGTERMTRICYRVEELGGDMRYIQFVWWG